MFSNAALFFNVSATGDKRAISRSIFPIRAMYVAISTYVRGPIGSALKAAFVSMRRCSNRFNSALAAPVNILETSKSSVGARILFDRSCSSASVYALKRVCNAASPPAYLKTKSTVASTSAFAWIILALSFCSVSYHCCISLRSASALNCNGGVSPARKASSAAKTSALTDCALASVSFLAGPSCSARVLLSCSFALACVTVSFASSTAVFASTNSGGFFKSSILSMIVA